MNDIFTDTINGVKRERPPVWFMRQAGRIIPDYLKLREKYGFHELMNTPELAAEVTLQPVHLLGVDAAILFSDILVIPEAMGMKLEFTDKGPRFEKALKDLDDPMGFLEPDASHLNYVYAAIDVIMETKPAHIPLIGFCGAPLTTLFYMLQGFSSNHQFPDAVEMMYSKKELVHQLLDAVTDMSIEYALNQVNRGVTTFQLFDTHAGLVPYKLYNDLIMPYNLKIIKAVQEAGKPVIFFPKGLGNGLKALKGQNLDFVGIDWHMTLSEAKGMLDETTGVQGNLDPRVLLADQNTIKKELESYLEFGSREPKWIFNLGHGVLPNIPFQNVKFVVDWIKSVDWKR